MNKFIRVSCAAGIVLASALVGGAEPTAAQPAAVPVARAVTAAPTVDNGKVTLKKTIERSHLVAGRDVSVDKRAVTVTVAATKDLRDRQAVTVSWDGAHPSGGIVTDKNAGNAALQEYPVVVMQCRGSDSATAPAAQRIRPQTCWTQTPDERFQYSQSGTIYPPYRLDRYATTEHRAATVDQPDPLPKECPRLTAAHWVPFVAADGTRYDGGPQGCAGLAPDAATGADSLQPGSTTYGVADKDGFGSTKFVMQNEDANASLGCSQKVKCSLVVIPIMGISCDVAGTASGDDQGMTPGTRPNPALQPLLQDECGKTGHFTPGALNPGASEAPDLPVTGSFWWSESNWRNRLSVPLDFAPSSSVCDASGNGDSLYAYGAESLVQATLQWSPHFCLDPDLFTLRHVQTSEPQAKNLLNVGSIEAAIQAAPPAVAFKKPVVQSPAALSGFAIAYSIDDGDGQPLAMLKLNARLIAKLLSESYRSCATCLDFDSKAARQSGFARMRNNPIDITRDPEFKALNPDVPATNYLEAAATMEFMSSDSDLMFALTSYLNADPEAREFLNGYPDPWGTIVNPAYKGIGLPVVNWPLLDTNIATLPRGANTCLDANPVPWLPLVASPVSNPATVALHLQFDISNSQTVCRDNGQVTQRLVAQGRQTAGIRVVMGLVSLGDAVRYQLNTAQLQTTRTSTGDGQFDDAVGRSFVGPTDAALGAAAATLEPDDAMGTWPVSYAALRGAKSAYPGTVLISIDVPTSGLPKKDARQYAQLLRFAAGRGQVRGLGAGDLPPGYLPLTGRNTAELAAYGRKAADAVQDQDGEVPYVSGKAGSGKPTTGANVAPNRSPGDAAVDTPAAGATGTTPAAAAPAASTPAPATSSAAASTPAAQPNAAPVGNTSALGAGALGLILPLLALLGVLSLGVAAWTSGVGRR